MPTTNVHSGSHPDTGYTTPNDVSGLVTPDDLDLPLDFGAFDDFPVTDSLQGFTSHPPSVPTPHTHHYPPQQPSHQPVQHPVHTSHGHGKYTVSFGYCSTLCSLQDTLIIHIIAIILHHLL